MIDEVLFEHVAPALDNIKQSLLEWVRINPEPVLKDVNPLDIFNFLKDLLVCVNLGGK